MYRFLWKESSEISWVNIIASYKYNLLNYIVGLHLLCKKVPNYFSKVVYCFPFPSATYESSCSFTSLLASGVISLLGLSHAKQSVVVSLCFNLQFPNDIWWYLSYAYLPSVHPLGEVSCYIHLPIFFLDFLLVLRFLSIF